MVRLPIFNSTRNKFFNTWNRLRSNEYTVYLQDDIKTYLENHIQKINEINNISSVPYAIDDDFQILTPWYTIDDVPYGSYRNWTIEFPSFPESWISGINPIILRKYGEDSTGSLNDTTTLKENYIIGIEDIEGSEDSSIKKTTISVGIVAEDDTNSLQDDIQVKLLLYIPTPNITI